MLRIVGSFLDPLNKVLDLLGGEIVARSHRRHAEVLILCGDTANQFAAGRVAGNEGHGAALELADCRLSHIEPQAGLPFSASGP